MTTQPSPEAMTHIVEIASRAPSWHNTQPWHWRATENALELSADRSRQLRLSDPKGRNLLISCGAVLHHALVAAEALGWDTEVERLPEGSSSSLLARITLRPGLPSETADADLRAIEERCTDRRHFTSWPVPDERLQHLAKAALAQGAHAVPLIEVSKRFRAELLVNRAAEHQAAEDEIVSEQRPWVDHSDIDGVPSDVVPADGLDAASGSHSRFAKGLMPDRGREVESGDGLILFVACSNSSASWLAAGEGLSAMWLATTAMGLSLVPLSQVIEVDETRRALCSDVLDGLTKPLILVRIGWQSISRSQIPRTSRRPVTDLLKVRAPRP